MRLKNAQLSWRRRLAAALALIVCTVAPASAGAQVPRLIADLNSAPLSTSFPTVLGAINGRVVFDAMTPETGRELFYSEGTSGSGGLLYERAPGVVGSSAGTLLASNSNYLLLKGGSVPLATDGTPAGTFQLTDLFGGSLPGADPIILMTRSGSSSGGGGIAGEVGYFFGNLNGQPRVYRTDFTVTGTVSVSATSGIFFGGTPVALIGTRLIVRDSSGGLHSVQLNSNDPPVNLNATGFVAAYDDTAMYFISASSETGNELWRTDGTPAQTRIILDYFTGSTSSFSIPTSGARFQNKWIFLAGPAGNAIITVDPDGLGWSTAGGVDAGLSGSPAPEWSTIGSRLLFTSRNPSGGKVMALDSPSSAQRMLLQTSASGTETGAVFGPIVGSGSNERRVFIAKGAASVSRDIWTTDGLTAAPLNVPPPAELSARSLIKSSDGALWYVGRALTPTDPVIRNRVVRIAPDLGSFTVLEAPVPFTNAFTVLGSTLCYPANPIPSSLGIFGILTSDSSVSNLFSLPVPTNSSNPRDFNAIGGTLIGFASTQLTQVFRSNGTPASTRIIETPGSTPQSFSGPYPMQSAIYRRRCIYPCQSGASSWDLCFTDGTTAGTGVFDVLPSTPSLFPSLPTVVGDWLFFRASSGASSQHPLVGRSDLTQAGTSIIHSVTTNQPQTWFLAPAGNELLFLTNPGGISRTTGIDPVQITPVSPTIPPIFGGNDSNVTTWSDGQRVYFWVVRSSIQSQRLAVYQSSTQTMDIAADVVNGVQINRHPSLNTLSIRSDGGAFFPALPLGIYFTDGTQAGARLITALPQPSFGSQPAALNVLGDKVVYIRAPQSPSRVYELWIADDAGTNTKLFNLGELPTVAPSFIPIGIGGRRAFAPVVGEGGRLRIVSTDGTVAGTRLLDPPSPNTLTSITGMYTVNSRLFFTGNWSTLGVELGVIDLCPADVDNNGFASLDDVFIMLRRFFENDPDADFDASGSVTIDDVFVFLNAWFSGCPS
jgi:ELWxxDGT repeat protein